MIAGAIMYQHGRRLAEIPCRPSDFGELATLQARAYLGAVNALSLVNPENAWVVLPVTPESVSNVSIGLSVLLNLTHLLRFAREGG